MTFLHHTQGHLSIWTRLRPYSGKRTTKRDVLHAQLFFCYLSLLSSATMETQVAMDFFGCCGFAQRPVVTLLVYGADPKILDASLVSITATPAQFPTPTTSFSVACPSGGSQEAKQCRAHHDHKLWEIWHQEGSVWGGTMAKSTGAPATTKWTCTLKDSNRYATGKCDQTVVSMIDGKKTTEISNVELDDCYVNAHQIPIVVTAGTGQYELGEMGFFSNPTKSLMSYHSSVSKSLSCPAATIPSPTGGTTSAANSVHGKNQLLMASFIAILLSLWSTIL